MIPEDQLPEEKVLVEKVGEFLAELRAIARKLLKNDGARFSINTDDLVQSAVRRQIAYFWNKGSVGWDNRGKFFAFMHLTMCRVLSERGRRRGRRIPETKLEDMDAFACRAPNDPDLGWLLGEGLNRLRKVDEYGGLLLEYRYFEQLDFAEIAEMAGMSEAAVAKKIQRTLPKLRKIVLELSGESDESA